VNRRRCRTRSEIVGLRGDRRQDGVQPGAVRQGHIDEGTGVIQPAPGARGQPLRQSAYCGVVGKCHRDALYAEPPIQPHLGRTVHHDIGDAGQLQQMFEGPGAGEFGRNLTPQLGQYHVVSEDCRLVPHDRGERRIIAATRGANKPMADPIDEDAGHFR
jgi:hypothetical protein